MEFQSENEKKYYDFLSKTLKDGVIDDSERKLLNKQKEKYNISDEKALELEEIVRNEYLSLHGINTMEEKEYYNLLLDVVEDGAIDRSERDILNSMKDEYNISDERALELEELAKLSVKNNSAEIIIANNTYNGNKQTNNPVINNFVLNTNTYYQQIFYNRLQIFIDSLTNADLNTLLHLTEPDNIYKNIKNALDDLFLTIYSDNNRNYLNEHSLYVNAIYDALIYNCMDNFQYCNDIIKQKIQETDKDIFYKSQETSLMGGILVDASREQYYKKGGASFSGFLLNAVGEAFERNKQLENQKKINEMQVNLMNNISQLLDEQVFAEIDNIFARTLQIIPAVSNAIYHNNLFLVFAEHNELYEDENSINLKNMIIENPNNWENWYNFAYDCYIKGKYILSLAIMHESIFDDNTDNPNVCNLLGNIYISLEMYNKARNILDRGLNIDQNDVNILISSYILNMIEKQFNNALEFANKLLNIDNSDYNFLTYKADALFYSGNEKEAQDIYTTMLQNNTDNEERHKEITEKLNFIKDSRNVSKKSWKVALILAVILPSFHRFYAGKIFTGIIDLTILIVSFSISNYYIFGFFYLIDIFFLLIGKFKDKNGQYITPY